MDTIRDYIEWFVDRTKQKRRCLEMLAGQVPMAVMLIEAPTSMGKTYFSKKIRHIAAEGLALSVGELKELFGELDELFAELEEAKRPFEPSDLDPYPQIKQIYTVAARGGLPVMRVEFDPQEVQDALWLSRQVRQQMRGFVPPETFNELTQVINKFTQANTAVPTVQNTLSIELTFGDEKRTVNVNLAQIRKNFETMQLSMIRTACFDLGIQYENLSGDTLSEKVVGMLETARAGQLLAQLVAWGYMERNHLTWWAEPTTAVDTAEPSPPNPETAADGVVEDSWQKLRATDARSRRYALDQIGHALRHTIRSLQKEHRLVFLFDAYEQRTDEADAWIDENLLEPLFESQYDNLLIIISGRSTPSLRKGKPLVGRTGLKPFTKEHVRQYLVTKRGIQEDDIDTVYKFSGGKPGALAMMAEIALEEEAEDDDW